MQVGRQREERFSVFFYNEILNEEIAFRLLFSFSILRLCAASDPP